MSVATLGIQGRCAHCQRTLLLESWQINAIAINEAFTCSHCQKALQLNDPKQIKRFRSVDSLAMLKASLQVMICTALLVAWLSPRHLMVACFPLTLPRPM